MKFSLAGSKPGVRQGLWWNTHFVPPSHGRGLSTVQGGNAGAVDAVVDAKACGSSGHLALARGGTMNCDRCLSGGTRQNSRQ